MINIFAKSDEEIHNGFSLFCVHKLISKLQVVTLTFDLQNW